MKKENETNGPDKTKEEIAKNLKYKSKSKKQIINELWVKHKVHATSQCDIKTLRDSLIGLDNLRTEVVTKSLGGI